MIVADLARPDAPAKIAQALAAAGVEPQYVVNNAGFGLSGAAAKLDRDEQLAMIDVNMRALTALSLAFVPSLERHRGGVLNVGSMAGFMPGPGMAVYYASKAYRALVHRFAASRMEAPRPARHQSRARAGPDRVRQACRHPRPAPRRALTQIAERVAELGYRGLMQGKALVVPGLLNRLAVALVAIHAARRSAARRSSAGRRDAQSRVIAAHFAASGRCKCR